MVLAFDVYGTLLDPAKMAAALTAHVGADAALFAARWRDKQVEYAFRRALMRRYVSFAECTKNALDFVCTERRATMDTAARAALMREYGILPAFADAAAGLSALDSGRLFAFSNGGAAAVQSALTHNNLRHYFADIISVEDTRSYKPDPAVYAYFLTRVAAKADDTWLISGNPFDIIGAQAAGWRTVWLNRGAAVFDPWEDFAPTVVVASLTELSAVLSA